MPACILCKDHDASFRFPKTESDHLRWKTALSLSAIPDGNTQICGKHFSNSDIETSAISKYRRVRKGATPFQSNNVETSPDDHTYSLLSKTPESACLSLGMMVATALVCWLPFILLVLFCYEEGETYSVEKKSSKFVPVTEGE